MSTEQYLVISHLDASDADEIIHTRSSILFASLWKL